MQHDAAIANPRADLALLGSNSIPIKLTTKVNSIDYNMEHKNRGYCLVFDIEHFNPARKLPRRLGSQVDSSGLFNLFRAMSFEVKVFKDISAKEIRYQLEYFAKDVDHTDNDCFVCIILTHGEHGQLWGSDARFPIEMMFNFFTGDNCPTLVGKPKVFFVQACQGEKLDHGVPVIAEAYDSSATYYKIPTHADFLIAYSTLPGFYSWRNTSDGSWFIQAVIKILGTYHTEVDLLTMLTIVNHHVAYYKSSNATSLEFNDKKQVPCITSMLTRRLFLRPKKIY